MVGIAQDDAVCSGWWKRSIQAARWLADRLFSEETVALGFRQSLGMLGTLSQTGSAADGPSESGRDMVIEMLNSSGLWERRSGQTKAALSRALVWKSEEWMPALSLPDTLSKVLIGTPCRFKDGKSITYGKEVPLAVYVDESMGEQATLIKSFRRLLRQAVREVRPRAKRKYGHKTWKRLGLEDQLRAFFHLFPGGELVEFVDRGKVLSARLSYNNAQVLGWKDLGPFFAQPKITTNCPYF